MENDLYQVIKEIQYMNDNGWFAAHLIDLLYKCGKLNILKQDKTKWVINIRMNYCKS